MRREVATWVSLPMCDLEPLTQVIGRSLSPTQWPPHDAECGGCFLFSPLRGEYLSEAWRVKGRGVRPKTLDPVADKSVARSGRRTPSVIAFGDATSP